MAEIIQRLISTSCFVHPLPQIEGVNLHETRNTIVVSAAVLQR